MGGGEGSSAWSGAVESSQSPTQSADPAAGSRSPGPRGKGLVDRKTLIDPLDGGLQETRTWPSRPGERVGGVGASIGGWGTATTDTPRDGRSTPSGPG